VFSVNFTLGGGLLLRLATTESATSPESSLDCRATNLPGPRTDPLADLVRALRHFVAGMPDVSCRWPDETGGHFLDLSRIDEGRCGIAVHAFADPGWRTAMPWLPRRGPLRFGADLPVSTVVSAFTAAFSSLRKDYGDDFGSRWPWPFPEVELSRLVAAQSLR
jgi:hypothetical protein